MGPGRLYTVHCPQCDRPASVSLARPESIDCDACGYSGRLPDDVTGRLRHASDVVKGLDAGSRQLSSSQRRALTSSLSQVGKFVAVSVLSGIPSILFLLGGLSMLLLDPPFWFGFAAAATPSAILFLTTILAFTRIRQGRRALVEASMAVPPAAEGQPASCRLCGAPIETSTRAVVRCDWCMTDNLVTGEVLGLAADRRMEVLEGFEKVVLERATRVRAVARRSRLVLILLSVGAPLASTTLFFVVMVLLLAIERPVNGKHGYALVETQAGPCVGNVYRRSGGESTLDFGLVAPPGVENHIRIPDADLVPFDIDDLVGKEVFFWEARAGAPTSGVVERVHGTALGENYAVVSGLDRKPEGLCLAPAPGVPCAQQPFPGVDPR